MSVSEDIEVHEEVTPVGMPPASVTSEDGAIAMTDALSAALDYEARGFSVIPLVPGTKRPAVPVAPYLDGSQRMTEAAVRAYWTARPEAGIGIVTGAPSGLVVVDVDPRNGGNNEATRSECPTELVAQTGSGGLHLFLRHPGGRVPCGKTSRPGVDRKGDGGYVVAAPSRHPDGGVYRWLNEGDPGVLPEWVLQKSEAVGAGEPREPWWVAETLAHPERVQPGTQEDTLTRLAWWAAGNLPMDIARVVLTNWMHRLPLGDPHDPWTDEHVNDRLERAFARRTPVPKVQLVDGTARQPGANHGEAKELRFLTFDELAAEVREMGKRPWLVEGWLLARGLFLIAGASHFGKTWLSIDLAVSAAIGGRFLGQYQVDPGEEGGRRVLYIVGEDDAPDFMGRLSMVLAGKDAVPYAALQDDRFNPERHDAEGQARTLGLALAQGIAEWVASENRRASRARYDAFRRNFRVHCERKFKFGDKAAEAALLKEVESFGPSLIIFDPLKDLVPGDQVEGFFAGAVEHTRFLRDLRDASDCCVGIVHHTKKAIEWDAADAGIIGRNEFIASFEHRFICYRAPASIEGDPDDGTELSWSQGVIQRRLKSSAPLGPVLVRYAGSGEELVLLGEEVTEDEGRSLVEGKGKSRSESLEPVVLQTIAAEGPVSVNKLRPKLQGMGVKVAKKTVQETVSNLVAAGHITRTKDGYILAGPLVPSAETPIGENGDHQRD
jgi:hypothetical protein